MNRRRPRFHPTISLRTILVGIAAVAVILGTAERGLRLRDFLRPAPASAKLFEPLIVFHAGQAEFHRLQGNEYRTELAPMPAALEAEWKGLEAEFRRNSNSPDQDLYDETAPYLRPGAPLPKRTANLSDWGDSY